MLNLPVFVELELTNRCNLKCIMCPNGIGKMTRPLQDMDMMLLSKITDQLKGHTKDSYLHQMGEPLLYPKLFEAIDMVSMAGMRPSISTNAMLLDTVMTERVLSSSLDEIFLCLDSLYEPVYNKIRRGGDFVRVMGNIGHFLNRRKHYDTPLNVIVQLIQMEENKGEWIKFESFFKQEGVAVLVKEYSTFAGQVKKGETPETRRFKCNKVNTHMTIQSNGDVVPCCRDFNGISVMGNVNHQLVAEIWNSDKYNEFRKNFRDSELCKEC